MTVFTLLVSGSGTGIGKTHVVAALASVARQHGRNVQIVKPVQTGVAPHESTDADIAAGLAEAPSQSAVTLQRFSAALAPLAAAAEQHATFDANALAQQVRALPDVDLRLVEGAGGLAVPLASAGWDWVDFAASIRADAVVLVVPDELGAINQSRLVHHYLTTRSRENVPGGIILNALRPAPENVHQSTRAALADAGIPLWGELSHASIAPTLYAPLTNWLTG